MRLIVLACDDHMAPGPGRSRWIKDCRPDPFHQMILNVAQWMHCPSFAYLSDRFLQGSPVGLPKLATVELAARITRKLVRELERLGQLESGELAFTEAQELVREIGRA